MDKERGYNNSSIFSVQVMMDPCVLLYIMRAKGLKGGGLHGRGDEEKARTSQAAHPRRLGCKSLEAVLLGNSRCEHRAPGTRNRRPKPCQALEPSFQATHPWKSGRVHGGCPFMPFEMQVLCTRDMQLQLEWGNTLLQSSFVLFFTIVILNSFLT